MMKFPKISRRQRILGKFISSLKDFKETKKIAGIRYALWKLQSNFLFGARETLRRSQRAGRTVGRSTAEWVEEKTNREAISTFYLHGEPYGYSEEGELLYPLRRQWD